MDGAKLNDVSCMLESISTVGKARVRMSLRETPSFAVFPGQAVAVEGNNPTGKLLVVNKVFEVWINNDKLLISRVSLFRDGLKCPNIKISWKNTKNSVEIL